MTVETKKILVLENQFEVALSGSKGALTEENVNKCCKVAIEHIRAQLSLGNIQPHEYTVDPDVSDALAISNIKRVAAVRAALSKAQKDLGVSISCKRVIEKF